MSCFLSWKVDWVGFGLWAWVGGHHLCILQKVKNGLVEAILSVTNPF